MTRLEFVSAVQRRLGMRTDLSTEILAESVIAQENLSQIEPIPWFLLRTYSDTVPTGNEYDLPTDFIRMAFQDRSIFYTDDTSQVVKFRPIEELRAEYLVSTPARPKYVAYDGFPNARQRLTFFPTPDVNYTAYFYTYRQDSALNAGGAGDSTVNLWLRFAPLLLVWETVFNMSVGTRDPELVSLAAGERARLRDYLDRISVAKQEEAIERIRREQLPEVITDDSAN